MSQPLLIGLAGPMGCGKSTVASHLHQLHNFHEPLAFADPLKDAVCAMLNVTRGELERLKRTGEPVFAGRSVRYALQTLGTEWGRQQVADDVWLQLMDRHLDQIARWTQTWGVVIADVRFENEADFIRQRGGTVVHMERLNNPLTSDQNHASEATLKRKPYDMVLLNDGDLAALYQATDAIANSLLGNRSAA